MSEQHSCSFNHLVGNGKQRRRDGQAEHCGGLIVDDQFELVRLHHRQARRLGALEDAAGVRASLTPCIRNIGSVAYKPAGFRKIAGAIRRCDRITRRELD
jgi:hypothetical protein